MVDEQERFVERNVTYTLVVDGRLVVVENVPARVSVQTGEQLFSPETVERIHRVIQGGSKPVRVIEAPVYDLAA